MKKIGTIVLVVLLVLVFIGHLLNEDDPFSKVKKGRAKLLCHIKGKGVVEIPPEKVTSFIDERGIWVFSNGAARNCTVVETTTVEE